MALMGSALMGLVPVGDELGSEAGDELERGGTSLLMMQKGFRRHGVFPRGMSEGAHEGLA